VKKVDISKLKAELLELKDPRRTSYGNIRHKLEDIIIIGLCSVMSCGEDFDDMEEFGKDREEWLRGFLELPNGIPDRETFRRVYERLDSKYLSKALNNWLDSAGNAGGRSIGVDGKTIRGSGNEEHKAYHVVSAWVNENSITLGEIVTDDKSNEKTAIPELLDMIDIEGDIVTIDAMGCETEIAAKIRERGADYVLSLKDNHPTFHEEIGTYFDWLETEKPESEQYEIFRSRPEKDHGRIEKREVTIASASWYENAGDWADLATIIRYRCSRFSKGVETTTTRHYISSFDTTAENFCELIRGHWSIENNLHWVLDVALREDDSKTRKDNSPLNLNVLRKAAANRLKFADVGYRLSIRKKMLKAARDVLFLQNALFKK
jgi:predicted transposase YbfD/YdcC